MATLRLQLQGEPNTIAFRAWIAALENAFGILKDLDAAISGQGGGTLDWVVTGLSTGSLVAVVESRSRTIDRNVGPDVARAFVSGFRRIEREGTSPPYLSELGMRRTQRFVRLVGRDGISGVVVSDQSDQVEISAQASVNIDPLLKVRHKAIGSVEGRLETISIHGKPRFVVYHSRTRKAVTCKLADASLLSQAKDALGMRIIVFGTVYSNEKGEPLRVDASRIRVLRDKENLPTIAEMQGSDPDFTGGMSTEEYIGSVRVG